MEVSQIVFLSFFSLIGGLICWSDGASFLRILRSRNAWASTTGRVLWFGMNYGIPSISYEYTVDGKIFTGGKFTPGPLVSNPKGSATSKSNYLKPDGSLRFPSGSVAEVFYNPRNPTDSCLLREMRFAYGFLIGVPLLTVTLFGFFHSAWITKAAGAGCGLLAALLAFTFIGLFFALFMGIPWLQRYVTARSFPTVSGNLITAEVAYLTSSGPVDGGSGGGYVMNLEFEYPVGGMTFRSQQLGSLPFYVLKSSVQDIQAEIDRLKSETELRVFHDPNAPWDGFLKHVSLLQAIAPMLMGSLFACVGFFLLCHQLKGHLDDLLRFITHGHW